MTRDAPGDPTADATASTTDGVTGMAPSGLPGRVADGAPGSAPSVGGGRVADGAPGAVPGGYAPPRKRSITIAGHPTSISLEPLFWQRLEAEAAAQTLPLSALVATIDAARIATEEPPNLASAIRTWLLWRAVGGGWMT